MDKRCAWCGTVLLEMVPSGLVVTSHALCSDCLGELRSALASNGLRAAENELPPRTLH